VRNTFVIPVLREGCISRCLETLYAQTPPNFYVIIVDQTQGGLPIERWRRAYRNLMLLRTPITHRHASGNLGFAKAVNLASLLVATPYLTICNDDVEFINRRWWLGVMHSFQRAAAAGSPAIAVNPMSVKIPHWAIGRQPGDDHFVLSYSETYSDADWRFLVTQRHVINERLTLVPDSAVQGVEMFCSVVDMAAFRHVGPLNERFYPGGGEDYEYARRARASGYACLSTTRSWVFHHWGVTRDWVAGPARHEGIIDEELQWNDAASLWADYAGPASPVPPTTIREL
jgi:GT2 family glycosyltransferase